MSRRETAAGGTGAERVWFAQALRAFACLTVVVAHYTALFVLAPGTVGNLCLCPPLAGLPRPAYLRFYAALDACRFSLPNFGVAIFFLVSGFVIPFSLRRNTLVGFFVRRFFRLYPTLWLVQLLVLAALALNARHYGLPFPFGKRIVAGNAFLVSSYFGQPFIESVCWTLLVEELFYALAALCAWRRLLDRPAAVLLVALAAAAVAASFSFPQLTVDMPGWHYPVFFLGLNATFVVFIFIGVALHHLHRGAWRPRLALPMVLALFGLFVLCCRLGVVRYVGGAAPWLTTGSAALLVFGGLLAADRYLPYSRWLDRLADVSYPLYLTHATLGYLVIRAVYLRTGSLYLGFAAAFAAAVALAALLHRFVERPGNDLGRRVAARLAEWAEAREARSRRAGGPAPAAAWRPRIKARRAARPLEPR
jgi:peptidoglycan/LPS O-acetylase OafA/YrhL